MNNTFQILANFLEQHGDDVEGRAMAEPPAETQRQIRLLVAGKLPELDQAGLFSLLNQNPDWVSWLARELKTRREPAS